MPCTRTIQRLVAITCSFILSTFAQVNATSAACIVSSGPQKIALLELYTSEGCSSCPPADQWVSSLAHGKRVSAALLPLAFHVDYWDSLGWHDPFSQTKFSDRQREYSRRRGASFVFTPQLLLDGESYRRPLIFDDLDEKVESINRSTPRASLQIALTRTPARIDARVNVQVAGSESHAARVYIALYENNLQSTVKAGENKGAILRHDFVVRELSDPLSVDGNGLLAHEISFRVDSQWKARDLHLAAFVQDRLTGKIFQALNAVCQ